MSVNYERNFFFFFLTVLFSFPFGFLVSIFSEWIRDSCFNLDTLTEKTWYKMYISTALMIGFSIFYNWVFIFYMKWYLKYVRIFID